MPIQQSVGRNGRNQRSDVTEVQQLINRNVAALAPMRAIRVDGECGTETIQAILRFQRVVMRMSAPDGRVDPGGPCYQRLSGVVAPAARGVAAGVATAAAGASAASAAANLATGAPRYHYTPGPQAPLADIAVPYIGATEAPGNRMGTDPRMREIFEADRLMSGTATDGYPWCCAFVSMCTQKLIRQTPAYAHVSPPYTAGVSMFRTVWAPGQNCLIFRPGDAGVAPSKGDIVVYTFSHIGIVTGPAAGGVTTIEGNTNAAGSREGTTVERKTRANGLIRCFIRLPLLASSAAGV